MRFISDHKRTWLRWLPAAFFAAAIFIFSSIPGKEVSSSFDTLSAAVQTISPPSSQTARTPLSLPKIEWLKVGHAIGYFCPGFTVFYALNHPRWSPLAALVICSLYAITDEVHQAFTPGRSAAGRDVLLDSLASLAGILILLGIEKWGNCSKSG